MNLEFDPCFDQKKIIKISAHLPQTYAELNRLAPFRNGRWPTKIHCMSDSKVIEGRMRGAGHGYTYPGKNGIWMNHNMTTTGYWLVLVHESLHHAWPDATEKELNCRYVPRIYEAVFGKVLTPEFGRRHGLGSPLPGMGDRSFCR